MKLQEKNLLDLYKDPKDARTTRVKLSEYSYDFWQKTDQDSSEFMMNLFKDISDEEMNNVRSVFYKLNKNLSEMENK